MYFLAWRMALKRMMKEQQEDEEARGNLEQVLMEYERLVLISYPLVDAMASGSLRSILGEV